MKIQLMKANKKILLVKKNMLYKKIIAFFSRFKNFLNKTNFQLAQTNDQINLMMLNIKAEFEDLRNQNNLLISQNEYQANLIEFTAKTLSYIATIKADIKDKPLVSIIMPAWNRENIIKSSIESIQMQLYDHWELIIVNDGSTDNTKATITPFLVDKRIRYFEQSHFGCCYARNFALEKSRGDLISYLDSDNYWFSPYTLLNAVQSFISDPDCKAIHFAAIFDNYKNQNKYLNFYVGSGYDDQISHQLNGDINGIDINCFMHNRSILEFVGGFDEQLTRLVDYDFIHRCFQKVAIKSLPIIGTNYRLNAMKNTITDNNNFWHNLYLIRSKYKKEARKNQIRVLYVLNDYPQITESYVYTEIEYMNRQGVYIEIWRASEPRSPFKTSIPIHKGTLSDAIEKMRPDIIHSHWINIGLSHADLIYSFNLSLTVRGHGFEYNQDTLKALQDHPAVHRIYLFNNFYNDSKKDTYKLKSVNAVFNPTRYFPDFPNKDRKLVLRVGAALITKDLQLFIRVAHRCPDLRFMLIIGRANCSKSFYLAEQLKILNEQLGGAVEILLDVMPEDICIYTRKAGVYFHTHSPQSEGGTPYGMPVSICEAMATGAYVIGRDCEAARNYIGDKAHCYSNEDEAISLLNDTLKWDDEKWHQIQQNALDRAYNLHLDERQLSTIYNDFIAITEQKETIFPEKAFI